jgi:hypothetical protein
MLKAFILCAAMNICASTPQASAPQPAAERIDLTAAAEQAVQSVVYIKVTTHAKVQTVPYRSPFDDFFSEFFGQQPGNSGRERQVQTPKKSSTGSGVILTHDGYIVTNNHVVAEADELLVRLNDNREFKARIIGLDETTDLALIKIEATSLPAITVGNSSLPYQTAPGAVLVQNFEEFHGFSVQNRRDQASAPVVHKLERKERVVFIDQTEKDLVSLPDVELPYLRDVHPLQLSFIAGNRIALEAIRCKKMHILRDAVSRYKGHDSAESPGSQCVAGLLPDLSQQTLLRTFPKFKMTADTDPLVMIAVIFFLDTVHHQVLVLFFDITQSSQGRF